MNVVRSAGGGGNDNYKFESENTVSIHPIARPTCSISELMQKTNFSKEEIRHLYRTFKQDCPSGEVSKTHFASVFSSIFPGGDCFRYAAFLFRNIDRSNSGCIRFEDLIVTLSTLIHGSTEDCLNWIFELYDINKDGKLTKAELAQVVASIFQLVVPVSKLNYASVSAAIEERTEELFTIWDMNGNGFICKEDFLRYCLQDEMIQRSIETVKMNMYL